MFGYYVNGFAVFNTYKFAVSIDLEVETSIANAQIGPSLIRPFYNTPFLMGLKPPFFLQTFIIEMLSNGPPPPPPSLKIPPSSLSPTPLSYAPLPDINEPLGLEGLLEWL